MATVLKRNPETNVGEMERWLSLASGAGLAAWGLTRQDKGGLGLAAIGGILAWRGATGHCNVYQAFGVNTAARGYAKGTGSKSGVPYELGIRVDCDVTIAKPVSEVYKFWRNLENLPRFMNHIDCIRVVDERNSHWVVNGPAGMKVEWDAEIVNDIPDQVIGWRSLPGSQVDNGGSVRFAEAGEDSTIVRVSLQYNPPAGTIGARIARMFGEDPAQTIQTDMQRFKELMETGAISVASTAKRPRKSTGNLWGDHDNVQQASEESFPASDSPSWTPERV